MTLQRSLNIFCLLAGNLYFSSIMLNAQSHTGYIPTSSQILKPDGSFINVHELSRGDELLGPGGEVNYFHGFSYLENEKPKTFLKITTQNNTCFKVGKEQILYVHDETDLYRPIRADSLLQKNFQNLGIYTLDSANDKSLGEVVQIKSITLEIKTSAVASIVTSSVEVTDQNSKAVYERDTVGFWVKDVECSTTSAHLISPTVQTTNEEAFYTLYNLQFINGLLFPDQQGEIKPHGPIQNTAAKIWSVLAPYIR